MRRRVGADRLVAETFIEPRRHGRVRAKPEASVKALRSGLEFCDERAADPGMTAILANVQMTQSTNAWRVDVRIGRDAPERDEPPVADASKKELARSVEMHALRPDLVDEASDESKALDLGERA